MHEFLRVTLHIWIRHVKCHTCSRSNSRHMNASCPMWIQEWSMSHMHESSRVMAHIWRRHVTRHACSGETLHMWMHHVPCEIIKMKHVPYAWVSRESCLTYEDAISNAIHVAEKHEKYERVKSHVKLRIKHVPYAWVSHESWRTYEDAMSHAIHVAEKLYYVWTRQVPCEIKN